MFTADYRDRVRRRLLEIARSDSRIESGAAVGGSALPETERWSDIDLAFGLTHGTSIDAVLADWTKVVEDEFGAVMLFDLRSRAWIYRVFLFPGALQVDLSFAPGADFGPRGPRFSLLFGTAAAEADKAPPASPQHLFGLGVHHAVRARICTERGKFWQAEYWISDLRDQALGLACLTRGLAPEHGRGFDELPLEIRDHAASALVRSLDRSELERALSTSIGLLLREAANAHLDTGRLDPMLNELVSAGPGR